MEIRYSTGSKKPESITIQLLLLVAISPRAMTALTLREYSGPKRRFRAASVTLWPSGERAHWPILLTNWRLVRTQPATASPSRNTMWAMVSSGGSS